MTRDEMLRKMAMFDQQADKDLIYGAYMRTGPAAVAKCKGCGHWVLTWDGSEPWCYLCAPSDWEIVAKAKGETDAL